MPVESFHVDSRVRAVLPSMDAPFFQAGLAGYSDAAMRLVARKHGAPYCITEALLDRILMSGGKGLRQAGPASAEVCAIAGLVDEPTAGQIIGTQPAEMAAGAGILADMGYDVIDVNLACPVRKIARKCRGGHFLAHPEQAIPVLKAVREAVPAHIPTTVKLRRGSDDSAEAAANFYTIFEALYEIGYSWATVHGRTVEQKYIGPSRWPFLRDLTQRYPDRVIFGSGDIWDAADIFRMIEQTGVQAVSVARGCIGNPWIFRQARQIMAGERPTAPTIRQQRDVLLEHFDLSCATHGEQTAGKIMRKFGIKFSHHHPQPERVKAEFIAVHTTHDWRSTIGRWYPLDDASDDARGGLVAAVVSSR